MKVPEAGAELAQCALLSVNTVDITEIFERCNLKALRVTGSISLSYLCCELKEVDSEEVSQIRRGD